MGVEQVLGRQDPAASRPLAAAGGGDLRTERFDAILGLKPLVPAISLAA